MVLPIRMDNQDDMVRVNRTATKYWFDIYVHSKTSMIDAKSLLGLSTLVGRDDLVLVFPDDVDAKKMIKAFKITA